MKRLLATICIGLLVSACAPKESANNSGSLANPNTLTGDPGSTARPAPQVAKTGVLATISGRPITVEMIQGPLMEAYGLQFMLHFVQLDMARQRARDLGLSVTAEDIAKQRQQFMEQTFKEVIEKEESKDPQKRYDDLLARLLETQRITKSEFELGMETMANLRKVAEAQLKERVKDEDVKEAFNIEYGEKVQVRHIQLANLREVGEALRQLNDDHKSFEQVAAAMSRDENSKPFGGQIRPFSRAERMWPAKFVQAAFELKTPGEISDAVNDGTAFHLIKLERKIPPSNAVKFEDVKEGLRQKLFDLMVQFRVKQMREEMMGEAKDTLFIEDANLRRQYRERFERLNGETPRDNREIRKDLELDRPKAPATQPNTGDAGRASTPPPRPPATMPGK